MTNPTSNRADVSSQEQVKYIHVHRETFCYFKCKKCKRTTTEECTECLTCPACCSQVQANPNAKDVSQPSHTPKEPGGEGGQSGSPSQGGIPEKYCLNCGVEIRVHPYLCEPVARQMYKALRLFLAHRVVDHEHECVTLDFSIAEQVEKIAETALRAAEGKE